MVFWFSFRDFKRFKFFLYFYLSVKTSGLENDGLCEKREEEKESDEVKEEEEKEMEKVVKENERERRGGGDGR